MDSHRYVSGQVVVVALRSLSGPSTEDHFRIVRRYPGASETPMYHVRSVLNWGQRMVPEDELSVVTPSLVHRADNPSKVLHLFPEIVKFARDVTSSNRAGTKVSHDS